MICQIAFAKTTFERLIAYRLTDSFQPLASPIPFPVVVAPAAQPMKWIDGMEVVSVTSNRMPHDGVTVLNELAADGKVKPNPAFQGFWATALAFDIFVNLFLTRVEDVASAGLARPQAETVPILGTLKLVVRLSVGEDGIPRLGMALDRQALLAAKLSQPATDALVAAVDGNLPFDIGKELKDLLPPGVSKALNAGLNTDDAGSIVIRFEFPDAAPRPLWARASDWQTFSEGDPIANLGTQAWSVSVDGGPVAAMFAAKIDPLLKDEDPVDFLTGIDYAFFDGVPPMVAIKKSGLVRNACAGNDVRFDAFVRAAFTVPSNNVLRGTLSFDIDKNDWDMVKCFGLIIVNPFGPLITLFDQGQPLIGLGAFAADLLIPLRPIAVVAAIAALVTGLDADLAQGVIDDKLQDEPTVTKIGDAFAIDQKVEFKNDLTRDWLVVREVAGENGRLVMRGESRVPLPVLPRVIASNLEGFSKWRLVDRCNVGKGRESVARLDLALGAGYYHAAPGDPVPPTPTVPIKYATRNGGGLMYDVSNDALGIYNDPATDYRQIDYLSVPGQIVAVLREATVRLPRYAPFAAAPYPLRLRFYTNGGVREYEFPAPPIAVDYVETVFDAAERINRCKQLGANLLLRRYLELQWRPNPPPGGKVAQGWEVHVLGLKAGQQMTLWNASTGEILVEAFANRSGRAEASLVLADGATATALLVGLDDAPFRSRAEVRALSAAGESAEPAARVAMRQTVLTPIAQTRSAAPIRSVGFVHDAGRMRIELETAAGREPFRSRDIDRLIARGTVRGVAGIDLPVRGMTLWRAAQRRFMVLSDTSDRPEVVAEYAARAAADLGASYGDLFVQADPDWHGVTAYHRSDSVIVAGPQWEEDEAEAATKAISGSNRE